MRYRLPKNERLHSRDMIDKLFSEGKRKNSGCLTGFYLIMNKEAAQKSVQIMAVVSRKRFKKAVDRNLLKRRIRESYRLQKHLICDQPETTRKGLILAFVYRHDEIRSSAEIKKAVIDILNFLRSTI